MTSRLQTIIANARSLFDEAAWRTRDALTAPATVNRNAPRVAAMEDRLLFSATPLSAVVDLAGEGAVEQVAEVLTVDSATPSSENTATIDTATVETAREIVFIDSAVSDIDSLLLDLDDSRYEAFILDADRDGVDQISEVLAGRSDIESVHIVSHGENGSVKLGNARIDIDNIDAYAGQIALWQGSLASDADLLFYGCDLAATADGRTLVDAIGALCDCDVAASDDDTGHASFGGDWELEYTVGEVDPEIAFSAELQADWLGKLSIITVDTTLDVVDLGDGLTSLREAIIAANVAGGDTIELGPGTYTLAISGKGENAAATGDLDILKDVTIVGAGPGLTTITGDSNDRVFDARDGTITIQNVTITGGTTTVANGGGIAVRGGVGTTLNLIDAVVSNTSATDDGGGVFVVGDFTTFNATRVVFTGNSADVGAAIATEGAATFVDVAIFGNTATSDGGGISASNQTTIVNSAIYNNTAALGGGIYAEETLTLTNVTISGNTATTNGGGIYSTESTMLAPADVTATNVTIADNNGGTIAGIKQNGASTVTLKNTILDNNGDNGDGTFVSQGGNFDSDGSAGISGATVGDPMLGVLANNGGLTQTHALLAGSPAINNGVAGGPGTDQRGVARDGSPDAGAFELVAIPSSLWLTSADDVASPSGAPGLDSWTAGDVLSFDDPNLTFDPTGAPANTTDGTFSSVFNLDALVQDSDARLSGIHYLQSNITVGSGANDFALLAGDILFSTRDSETLQSNNMFSVTEKDLTVFRPDQVGNYSVGTFTLLLDGSQIPEISIGLHGLTLVESNTTVGDSTILAGTFLLVHADASDVFHYTADGVGSGTTSGTWTTLIDGSDINMNQYPRGIDLIETTTELGGTTLSSGSILLSLNFSDATVGDNSISADREDIFYLTVAKTEWDQPTTVADATLFFDGSDVGLDTADERVHGLTLTHGANAPPSITTDGGGATGAVNVAENTTTVTTVSATDSDLPVQALTYSISGGADQLLFNINGGTGVLTFAAAPDFESPTDAGGDNVYDVQVQVSDGIGGTDTQDIAVTVTYQAPTGELWFTTADGGNAGGTAFTDTDILQFGNIGDTFEPDAGTTSGTLSMLADFSAPADIRALHYVESDVIIGLDPNEFELQKGDLVMTLDPGAAPNIVTINVGRDPFDVERQDIVVFRPTELNDYTEADGEWFMLLDSGVADATKTLNVHGLSVVEVDTTVGGTTLKAGTLLVAHANPDHQDIATLNITGTGANSAADLIENFFTGSTVGNTGDQIQGLHLLQQDTAFGSTVVGAGTLLVQVNNTTAYGGQAHNEMDILILDVVKTEQETVPTTVGSATLLVEGQEIGLDGSETINGFTIISSSFSGQSNITNIAEVGTGPTVDGTIDPMWASASAQTLANVNVGTIDDANDLSANWKSVYDSTNLYFLVDVTDDTLVNDSAGESGDDFVQINIDADRSHGNTYDGINDFEYGFRYNDPGNVHLGANSVNNNTGVTYTLSANGTGYVLEVAVPWTTLGVTPADYNTLGIDVQVTDDDDGGTRDSKLAWNDSTDQAFQDPSTFGTATLNASPPSTVSALSGIEGTSLAFLEGDPDQPITATLAIADVDDTNIESATVQVTSGYVNGEDVLAFTDTANITGSWNAGTGLLTLSGSDTLAAYETALRSVTYGNASDTPTESTRTVSFTVNDGDNPSNVVARSVTVTATNDASVLSGIEGTSLAFLEGDPDRPITATLAIADVDDTNIESATVQITSGYVNGEDVLAFTDTANIIGSWNAGTGLLTLSGSDTLAAYQTALRSVTYGNASESPTESTRTVSFTVNDGDDPSNVVNRGVDVTAANDASVLSGIETTTLTFFEGDPDQPITAAISIADVDDLNIDSATVQITGNYVNGEDVLTFTNTANISGLFNATTGTLTLLGSDTIAAYESALQSVAYQNGSGDPTESIRTVRFTVNDGNDPSNALTREVSVTATTVGVMTTAPATEGTTENIAIVFSSGNGNAVTVDDGSAGNPILRTTLTVTNGVLDLGTTGGLTSVTGNGTSSVTVIGREGNINNALNGLIYTPTLNYSGSANLQVMTDLQADLVSYFTFENAGDLGSDTSPVGSNDGTASGGATSTFDIDRGGNVLVLDGVNDNIVFTGNRLGTPTSLTISGWVNINASNNHELFSIGGSASLRLNDIGVGNGITGFFHDGTSWRHTDSNQFIGGDGWHHVAYTLDDAASTQTIYVDGVALGATSHAGSINWAHQPNTTLGSHANGSSYWLNGMVDDARVYERALSSGEIQALAADKFSDAKAVAITINAANIAPTITSDGGGATAAVNVAENDTTVTTVTATDTNLPAQTLTFSIGGGADAAKFAINSSTGVLTFATAPDFETSTDVGTDNVYNLIVQVSDGTLTDTQAIAVAVTPVNDNAPVVDPVQSFNISETATNGTSLGTVTATDADAGTTFNNWTISGGNVDGVFGINGSTGQLTVADNSLLNFESITNYAIRVTVADGISTSAAQTVTIAVTDFDEFDISVITDANAAGDSVVENAVTGAVVGITASAFDADATNNTVVYTLDNDAGGLFKIHAATGVVTVDGALDFETANSHLITVRATSDDASTRTANFMISINDENEAPTISLANKTLTLPEMTDTTGGLAVADIVITDDALGSETLSLSGTDAADFEIVAGKLRLRDGVDLNFETKSVYTVRVNVNDLALPANPEDFADYTLAITNINEAPVLSGGGVATLYFEGDGWKQIARGAVISDPDNTHLVSATIQITRGYVAGEDSIVVTGTPALAHTCNPSTGTLTFTGTGTLAEYQQAIRSVGFVNSSQAPVEGLRTVKITLNDGLATSSPTARGFNVIAVNDAPVANRDVDAAAVASITAAAFSGLGSGRFRVEAQSERSGAAPFLPWRRYCWRPAKPVPTPGALPIT